MSFADSQGVQDPCNLIVNYLPQTLTDEEFTQIFQSVGALVSAKIVRDPATAYSYGYGFVRYQQEKDATQAIQEFTGLQLQNKTIKVSHARAKSDRTKGTNLYLGNLPPSMTEEELRAYFEPFGEMIQVRVIKDRFTGAGRGIGFVLFAEKSQSDAAIEKMSGTYLSGMNQPLIIRYTEESSKRVKPPGGAGGLGSSHYGKVRDPYAAYGMQQYGSPYGVRKEAYAPVEYPMPSAYDTDYGLDPYATGQYMADPYTDYSAGYAAAVPMPTRRPSHLGAGRGASNLTSFGRGRAARRMVAAPYDVMGRAPRAVPSLAASHVSSPVADEVDEGHILFVYNIGEDAEEKLLWELFAPYGAVTKVNVIYDFASEKATGKKRTKGYGFVTMPDYDEAANAVAELNGYYLKPNSKPLQVSFKKSRGG